MDEIKAPSIVILKEPENKSYPVALHLMQATELNVISFEPEIRETKKVWYRDSFGKDYPQDFISSNYKELHVPYTAYIRPKFQDDKNTPLPTTLNIVGITDVSITSGTASHSEQKTVFLIYEGNEKVKTLPAEFIAEKYKL